MSKITHFRESFDEHYIKGWRFQFFTVRLWRLWPLFKWLGSDRTIALPFMSIQKR